MAKRLAPPSSSPCVVDCRRGRLTGLRRVAALLVLVLVLVSCSNDDRPSLGDAAEPSVSSSTSAATTGPETTAVASLHELEPGSENLLGYIATPTGAQPEVHAEPDAASARIEVGPTTEVGAPTTFAIVGDPAVAHDATGGWYRVLLPTRPNESTGWVPAASVTLTQTPLRVLIDLEGRTLRVENNGATVFETTVAIGTEENPTPVGATYMTELIENTNPDGAYGPYAFGLALHSETLTEFAGGPGQVGVHGTNQPELIGDRVSHGCVRLENEDIVALEQLGLPLGVPVLIT